MSYKTRHDVSFHHQESSKIQLLESIKTNTENINVNIGDVEINTADLEVLQTLTNTKLQTDLDFAGQPNAIGDGSNMKRTMNYGYDGVGGQQRPLVVDGSGMLKVVVDSGAGTATEAKQDILEASLTSIESKMDIDNVVYDNILVKNTEIKDHLSNIDGLLDVQNELHLPGIDTKLETLETSLTSIEGKMYIDNAVFDTISSEIVSIDGKIKNGNDASLSTAQQVLTYGRTNTGDLHPLHITNNGDVEVEIADFVKGQATMAASFPVVLSSDQSSLTVDGAFFQATQPISGTVTANLSTTDNAVLDVIAANTADLENVNGKITACNTGAVVISSGTVTANLSTTDNAVLDVIAANTADLENVNGKITACNTGAVVISSSALPSGASTEAKQDILEASLVSIEAKMDVDNAVLDIIAANTADLENVNGKITACNTGAVVISSGAVTATLSAIDNAVLDVIAANTADLENVNGKITACNTGAVVISSGTVTANLSSTDNAVLDVIAANTADLENVNGKITACNTGAVVISSGAVTATLSAIDNAVLDVIAANTADLENVNGKITACNTGAVVVSSSALPSGAATEAKQDVLESSLVSIEAKMDVDNAVLDALELVNTVKDVEWLSNHTVANQSLSDPLDTEGYRGVTLYGENDGAIASGDFKIFGSNESAGTYYHMDSALSLNTSDSGRYCLVESSPLGTMTTARYLKLFNASGSSKTVLKLRAVLSEKMRYL